MQANDSLGAGAAPAASDTIDGSNAQPVKVKPRWDPKGKRNMMIIGGVIGVAILLLVLLFSGSKGGRDEKKVSTINEVQPDRSVVNGMLSQDDRAALAQQENARVAAALTGGQSVITNSVDPHGVQVTGQTQSAQQTPNPGFTQQGETRLDQPHAGGGPQTQAQTPTVGTDEAKLKGLESQMQNMMSAWGMAPSEGGQRTLSTYVREKTKVAVENGAPGQTGQQVGATSSQRSASDLMVVKAFDQPYAAELISGADSDTPGKLRARILSGPLSGAVVTGTTRRIGDKGFQLDFNQGSYNGKTIKIAAFGMDAEAPGDIVRGDYDGRYMQRYVFPVLSEGVKAYAGARAQTGTQVIAISVPGAGTGAVTGAQQTPAPSAEQARNAMYSAGADQVSRGLATGPKEGHVMLEPRTQFGLVFEQSIYQSDLIGQPRQSDN
ncbi:hypothetical protein ACWYXJ_29055 [Janthinobacterium lividum]